MVKDRSSDKKLWGTLEKKAKNFKAKNRFCNALLEYRGIAMRFSVFRCSSLLQNLGKVTTPPSPSA